MIHTIAVIAGILSTILAIYCCIPYLISIVKGKTKPHQFSWLIFTIMNAIVTLSQFIKGGRLTVLVPLVFLVFNGLFFVLSLKYGTRNTSRFDWFLLAFSLLTILAWILTKNSVVAIWLTVVIDVCATTMIILKIRRLHGAEDLQTWVVGVATYIFTCLALLGTPFGVLYIRPFYGLLTDALIVAAILYFSPDHFGRPAKLVKDKTPPSVE